MWFTNASVFFSGGLFYFSSSSVNLEVAPSGAEEPGPPKSVHLASAQVYRHQGHHAAAFVVQEVAKDPANLGPKIRDFINNPRQGPL